MANVTYLLGAGASANCVATVDNIPRQLAEVISRLRDISLDGRSDRSSLSYEEINNLLVKDLEWLLEQSSNHLSIDTFAKKLFLTNNMSLML